MGKSEMMSGDSRGRAAAKSDTGARYFWRAIAYFIALAAINVIAHGELGYLLAQILPSWLAAALESLVYLAGVLALTWAFCRFVDRGSLEALGLQKRGWLARLAAGWAFGAFLILIVFGILMAGGWISIESATWQPLELAAAVLGAVVVGFNEELAFRGYIMQRLSRSWGLALAVVGSSILFGLVHIFNPDASLLGILSVSLSGLLYALAYLLTGSLWLPMGLHMSWNLVQMHILGFPGSGHVGTSIMRSVTHGPELVTGGSFGPEGGIIVIGVTLAAVVVLAVVEKSWSRNKL
ncbi:MAG: CPBP family intramembrane metalloprotease [Anaerolineae bacterium]|nr:CPBP family intramembrane metalloprotease [Anaerolineae bacterium]